MKAMVNGYVSLKVQSDDINRIVDASRIYDMQELKKMVRFVESLIRICLNQIMAGMLSAKGAQLKILMLLSIVGHSQIGNHPSIKAQLDRLKLAFKKVYKQPIEAIIHPFKPTVKVLPSASIHHYIETIMDSQNDPMYSERPPVASNQPKTPLDLKKIVSANDSNHAISDKEKQSIRAQLLAIQLMKTQDHSSTQLKKAATLALSVQSPTFRSTTQFDKIRLSKQHHIQTTA